MSRRTIVVFQLCTRRTTTK